MLYYSPVVLVCSLLSCFSCNVPSQQVDRAEVMGKLILSIVEVLQGRISGALRTVLDGWGLIGTICETFIIHVVETISIALASI